MRLLLNTIMLEVNRWRKERHNPRPLIELLEPLRNKGFKDLEIWQYHLSSLNETQFTALAHAMTTFDMTGTVVGAYPEFHLTGADYDTMRSCLERIADCASSVGATTFKIFPGNTGSTETDGTIRAVTVSRLSDLATLVADRGMTLTLETHANTLCDTLESTLQLLDELGNLENLGICFQPYTEHDTNQALAAYDTLSPWINHIHLQNHRTSDGTATSLEEGDWIDYRALLSGIRNSGFNNLLCLEFTAGILPTTKTEFNPHKVIDNAIADRKFVLDVWEG